MKNIANDLTLSGSIIGSSLIGLSDHELLLTEVADDYLVAEHFKYFFAGHNVVIALYLQLF